MLPSNASIDLLHEQMADADTQWSLGTFGGIAEFSRDPDEIVTLTQSGTGTAAVTARGGIAIKLSDDCRPFAFECITKANWSQRVAFCLPANNCAMNRRIVLTELEADHGALRPQDRGSILFDLGLGALQTDLCVRIANPDTVTQLRRHCGRSVFDPANPAMGLLLRQIRIACSSAGSAASRFISRFHHRRARARTGRTRTFCQTLEKRTDSRRYGAYSRGVDSVRALLSPASRRRWMRLGIVRCRRS